MSPRNIAVAIPARNEQDRIGPCLERLNALARDPRVGRLEVVLLANNCSDQTAAVAMHRSKAHGAPLACLEVELPPERANAGWARRLALDAAADRLCAPADALLCTDADTLVAPDWLVRTLDHLDRGYDAVAGYARLCPHELRRLPRAHRLRLCRIRRYELAFDYLRGHLAPDEPWPRHFYEGGASMALTLASYRAIGGAPTPAVSEDKALFAALRAAGKRIRHARDVQVHTSCRLDGRAPGGAADTLAAWGRQDEAESLWGLLPVAALATDGPPPAPLTFAGIEEETRTARRLVRTLRSQRRSPATQESDATPPVSAHPGECSISAKILSSLRVAENSDLTRAAGEGDHWPSPAKAGRRADGGGGKRPPPTVHGDRRFDGQEDALHHPDPVGD